MSEPEPPEAFDVESVIREHFDRESETVDPRPIFDRIQASLPRQRDPRAASSPGGLVSRFPWLWGGVVAVAALLLLTLSLALTQRTALARADVVVREARQAHRQPIDRCYLVETRRDSTLFDVCAPMTDQIRLTRLWTRGDRFWVESVHPQQTWAWGRDVRGRFWIAFGPRRALRLEPDEVPYWLGLCGDLYSLRLEELFDSVLTHCKLEYDSAEGDAPATNWLIRATPRPGHYPKTRAVLLEIDRETRVVRRMTIERLSDGLPFATVTYTLVESEPLDERLYLLEGHVTQATEILTDQVTPERRRSWLRQWFGPEAAAAFPLREQVKQPGDRESSHGEIP